MSRLLILGATDGETFVGLIDRLVTSVDLLPLREVKSSYWPHRVKFERLNRSCLDWRLLCPGPMVDEPALGLDRLRISVDTLPVGMIGRKPQLGRRR